MNSTSNYGPNLYRSLEDRYADCLNRPPKNPSLSPIVYAHRLSSGMKAKKYKGGLANKAKFGSLRAFNKFFKPLEGLCSSND